MKKINFKTTVIAILVLVILYFLFKKDYLSEAEAIAYHDAGYVLVCKGEDNADTLIGPNAIVWDMGNVVTFTDDRMGFVSSARKCRLK